MEGILSTNQRWQHHSARVFRSTWIIDAHTINTMPFNFDPDKDAINLAKKGHFMHNTPKPTGTDWDRVKRETATDAPIPYTATDGPYNPNDAVAVAAYWQSATLKRGRGRPVADVKRPTLSMRIDPDVLTAFIATWPGWQTRINDVLRDAVARGVTA